MIRKIANISLFLIVISAISCNQNKKLEGEINSLYSKPIDLCLDQMMFYYPKGQTITYKDSISFYNKNTSLVVYMHKSECYSYSMKNMYKWYDILKDLNLKYNKKVKVYFIFAPEKEKITDIKSALDNAALNYPAFIDCNNVFIKKNSHLPSNTKLHTFLLDKSRNIKVIGSPIDNIEMKQLLLNTIDKLLNQNS